MISIVQSEKAKGSEGGNGREMEKHEFLHFLTFLR